MASVDGRSTAGALHFRNDSFQPCNVFGRRVDLARLFIAVQHQTIGHLLAVVLTHENDVGEHLNQVIGINAASGQRSSRVFQLHRDDAIRITDQAVGFPSKSKPF